MLENTYDAVGTFIYGDAIDDRCFYERMVILENGDLLATWMRSFPIVDDWDGTKSYYFYKSQDGGVTWSFLSELDPVDFGLNRNKQGMPGMYVLPQELAGFPAGTILFANTDWHENSEYTINIWRSEDHGVIWKKHSSLAPRGSRNTWEPEFIISADGRLVCYYSDERQAGYDQCIVLETSEDGGVTWSGETIIIGKYIEGWEPGVSPPEWRPGMPRVIRLIDGRYMLVHENIHFEPAGINSFRISEDGINWGNPEDAGMFITANGKHCRQCPLITLVEDGSINGRIIVRGMNDQCSPSLCYSSKDNGATWELIEAPLTAVRQEQVGSGWSGTFVATGDRLLEINNRFNGEFNEIRCGQEDATFESIWQ